MNELQVAYEKLYDSISGTQWEEGLCVERLIAEYTTFTAMQGHKYSEATNSKGEDFRFMLVGRAVNGWDEYRVNDTVYMTRQSFVDSSIANVLNSKETIIFGKDRFEWINTSGDSPCNTARVGIDRGAVAGEYSLRKAQIWNYTKPIWDKLYGEETLWSERWFENIVWSNLYKIAPHDLGNPSGRLQTRQREACVDLLKAEIEYFMPTHIFFATGREGWFSHFSKNFSNVRNIGTNISSGANRNEEYVEAVGDFVYSDGKIARAVVACRPEGRAKNGYVEQICSYFG